MADTWDIDDPLRPRSRSTGSTERRLRPEERPDRLGQVSETVASDATHRDVLPLDRTALIGLFDGPNGSAALLRLADGSVVKVQPGEAVNGGRVTAIDLQGLRLQRNGEEVVLTLPS
jgi:hypothetical protein